MQNKKINWWALIAIIIIGVSVGYVATGFFKNKTNKDKVATVDSIKGGSKDSTIVSDSIINEKEDIVVTEPIPVQESDVVSEGKSKINQDKQPVDVRPKVTDNVDEKNIISQPTPKKLYASVKPNSLSYAVNGGSKKINISSNTDWQLTVQGGEDWIKPNISNGNGNKTISLVAQENKMTSQRTATIEVRWTDQNDDERISQIKVNQAAYVHVPEPITVNEAQAIVASGRTDSRIPDNCKMVGNGINTSYKQFRTNVTEKKYESVTVESVSSDKKGNVSQIRVKVVRPEPIIINKETKVEKKEELANKLKNELQSIVAKGQKSSKVPDDCTILVNGRNKKDYQNFRMGVNWNVYSNVKVLSVSTDSKGNVTQINVSATESKDSE